MSYKNDWSKSKFVYYSPEHDSFALSDVKFKIIDFSKEYYPNKVPLQKLFNTITNWKYFQMCWGPSKFYYIGEL